MHMIGVHGFRTGKSVNRTETNTRTPTPHILPAICILAVWLPPVRTPQYAIPIWPFVFACAVVSGLWSGYLAPAALVGAALLLGTIYFFRLANASLGATGFRAAVHVSYRNIHAASQGMLPTRRMNKASQAICLAKPHGYCGKRHMPTLLRHQEAAICSKPITG
jgi:hypothetical protein